MPGTSSSVPVARTADGGGDALETPPPSAPALFEYAFPAIRGVQAGRVFFVSMCPLKLLPKIFLWDDDDLPTELRAQRTLNKGRIPDMARYIEQNPTSYTFSAITASVDAPMRFVSHGGAEHGASTGVLYAPMDARFVINDGQHRRAAIEQALKSRPELGDESIAVVFFIDKGLARCQQMFADLNRHAVRASNSIAVLYDHRDQLAGLTRVVALTSPVFCGFVEMEATSLPKQSRRLFTLSAIYGAHRALFEGVSDLEERLQTRLATAFWEMVDQQFPEWEEVRQRRMRSPEVRADFIHSHGIALTALGRVGNGLLRASREPEQWRTTVARLGTLDWSRHNGLWAGRAIIAGRVSKAANNVLLTTAAVRKHLGLPLPPDEQRAEDAYKKERRR